MEGNELLMAASIFIITLLFAAYCSMRKNRRTREQIFVEKENESLKKIKELVFKIGLLSHSGKACIWDYNFEEDTFGYPDTNNSLYDGYSWDKYLTMVHPNDRHIPIRMWDDIYNNNVCEMKVCYRLFNPELETYVWTDLVCVVSEYDLNGKPRAITGLRWDITEQKEQELKLEENMRIMQLALDKFDIYPWEYATNSEKLSLFNRSDDVFSEEHTLISFLNEMVHPEDRERCTITLNQYVNKKGNSKLDLRLRVLRKNTGQYAWVDITGTVIETSKHGKKILGIGRIVSAEVARDMQLLETKEMLEHAFGASNIIPWEFSPDKMMVYSPCFDCRESENNILLNTYLRLWIHSDFRKEFQKQINNLVKGKQDFFDAKVKARTSVGGKYEWVHITGRNIRKDNNGNSQKVFGTLRVITSEVKREKELISLHRKAEESNRLKTAFLENISHEIRTPLNAIVGFSQILTLTEDPEEKEEYARLITTNNELLLQLINDIIDISKIETGECEFNYSDVDLKEVFTDISQTYSPMVKPDIRFDCEIPKQPKVIYTEKTRLKQVLANFVSNAIKFTSKGNIIIGYNYLKDKIRFYVKDTGKGIAKEDQEKIFERFTKLDTFTQGTGMGLSICQTIAERFNGEVGVESEPGTGSEFWFTLPLNSDY